MRQQQESSGSVSVQRLGGWHAKAAWLGVTALILQALIPFAQGILVPGDESIEQALLFQCKALTAAMDPAEPQPASGQRQDCVVCIAGAIGHCLIAPSIFASVSPDIMVATIAQYSLTDMADKRAPTQTTARSPPISA